jgi:2-C-methyl-D-erythritol 4-phosphate cytidylyltransferase
MNVAIIVAAGSSQRMGFNKLLAPLAGVPVLQRTLMAFQACPTVDAILLVAGEAAGAAAEAWRTQPGLEKLVQILPGGSERHFSVWSGLQACPAGTQLVAVHDGARPLIQPSQIQHCFDEALKRGAVACARPMPETLKRVGADGCIRESIDRTGLWVMETPQIFRHATLVQAYQAVLAAGLQVTDEVSALQAIHHPVHVVENTQPNLKITFPADVALAERLLG